MSASQLQSNPCTARQARAAAAKKTQFCRRSGHRIQRLVFCNYECSRVGYKQSYPHTWGGLAACFAAAVPFYRNQIAGDAFYTVALFGADAIFRGAFHSKPQVA
jgi:hypothetical protein